jgi:hypothetical protein
VTRLGRRVRNGRPLFEPWMAVAGAIAVVALLSGARAVLGTRGDPGRAGRTGGGASAKAKSDAGVPGGGNAADPPDGTGTAVFARLRKYDTRMRFPASSDEMLAVGFHQSWNPNGTEMMPALTAHGKDKYESTKKALAADARLKLFLMMSRGRGSSEYTAADCAVKPGATILSPVTGVVTLVTTYHLIDYGADYRIEIKADDAEPVRVVLIHLRDPKVKVGQRVLGGVTPIAVVRHLTIDSQVNRYLPWPADHTHVQVNAVGYKLNAGS